MLDGEPFGLLFCIDSFEEGADTVRGEGERGRGEGEGEGEGWLRSGHGSRAE